MQRFFFAVTLVLVCISNIACTRAKGTTSVDSIGATPRPSSKPFVLDSKQSDEFIKIIQTAPDISGNSSVLKPQGADSEPGFVQGVLSVEEMFAPEFGGFVYVKVNEISSSLQGASAVKLKKMIEAFKANKNNNVKEKFPSHQWFELSINARCLKDSRICEFFAVQNGGAAGILF